MTDTLLATATQCVHSLYSPTSTPETRRQADSWLQKMTQMQEAWMIANAFLNTPSQANDESGEQRIFFGSIIFAQKLRNNLRDLPLESLGGLRDTLQANIARFAALPGSRPTLRQLCVALADLLLQGEPTMDPRAVIGELVGAFPPASPLAPTLLLLLKTLAEEAETLPALGHANKRFLVRQALRGVGKDVLDLLQSLFLAAAGAGQVDAMNAVFLTLGSWLNFPGIEAGVVAVSPLLGFAVDAAIGHPTLFASSLDALLSLVESYMRTAKSDPAAPALAAKVTDTISRLQPLWARVLSGEDEDGARTLSRLFSDAAYAFLPELLGSREVGRESWGVVSGGGVGGGGGGGSSGSGGGGGGVSGSGWEGKVQSWVALLSLPVHHPMPSVVEPTFRTWRKVSEEVSSALMDEEDLVRKGQGSGGRRGAALLGALAPPLLALVPQWVARLTYPPTAVWEEERNSDDRDQFKHEFRYDCSDSLLLCAQVAGGGAVLKSLASNLQSSLAAWSAHLAAHPPTPTPSSSSAAASSTAAQDGWQGVEAALYSLKAIGRKVDVGEGEVLPALFPLLLGGSLPLHIAPELLATAFRVVGRYSEWLCNASSSSSSSLSSTSPRAGEVAIAGNPNAPSLTPLQLSVWGFLMGKGFGACTPTSTVTAMDPSTGAVAFPTSVPTSASHYPSVPFPSPATECAAFALSRFSSFAGSALDAELLSLPLRLHLPAFHPKNAHEILAAWAYAALRHRAGDVLGCILAPGASPGCGAGVVNTAVVVAVTPIVERLGALCGDVVVMGGGGGGGNTPTSAAAAAAGGVAGAGGPGGATTTTTVTYAFGKLASVINGGSVSGGALTLLASDGTLYSSLANSCGEVSPVMVTRLGVSDVGVLRRLLEIGRVGGGNLTGLRIPPGSSGDGWSVATPGLFSGCLLEGGAGGGGGGAAGASAAAGAGAGGVTLDPSLAAVLTSPRALHCCASTLLEKLKLMVVSLTVSVATEGRDGSGSGSSSSSSVEWAPFAPPGFPQFWASADKSARQVNLPIFQRALQGFKEAQVSALATLFTLAWPGLEGLLRTYGLGAPPPLPPPSSGPPIPLDMSLDFVDGVADMLRKGLASVGAPLYGFAQRFVAYLTGALGVPTVGPHAIILRSAKRFMVWVGREEEEVMRVTGGGGGGGAASTSPLLAQFQALKAAIHACARSALRVSLRDLSPIVTGLLSPRANVGERVSLECADALLETLELANAALEKMPGGLVDDGEGGVLLPALLQLASAALASCHPRIAVYVSSLLEALEGLAKSCHGTNPARAANINAALSSSYGELVRRLVHASLLAQFREILISNGFGHGYNKNPSLASAMRACASLAPPDVFLQCLSSSLKAPGAAFGPELQSRITPVIHDTLCERMRPLLVDLGGRGAATMFEDLVYALHIAVVNGDLRELTTPNIRSDNDYDYAFEDEVWEREEAERQREEGDRWEY